MESETIVQQTSVAVLHSTFTLERTYPSRPERVFAAFSTPEKKSRWYANRALMEIEEYTMDFRVGGVDRGRFRFREDTLMPGAVFTNVATYQDIVPNSRIVVAYTMAFGEKRFSASLSTFEFAPADAGTRLVFTEQSAFFEGADGPVRREDGWKKLLAALAEELAAS